MGLCRLCGCVTKTCPMSRLVICNSCRTKKCVGCGRKLGHGTPSRKRGYHLRCKKRRKENDE